VGGAQSFFQLVGFATQHGTAGHIPHRPTVWQKRSQIGTRENGSNGSVFGDGCIDPRHKSQLVEKRRPICAGKMCDNPLSQPTNTEIRNTHINIGTGVDISIRELAETIKKIIGFQGELYFNADKPDGTMLKLTDPSKLHQLGWHHKIELQDGIKKMYDWYQNRDV